MTFSYSVAIRTLGTAGQKYLETLKSISNQSIPPTSIYVYIPYGYSIPEQTIGVEKYIRCDKGMVTQRSLPFTEIDDEWILFLDDDIFLPSDFVERAREFVTQNKVDLLTPDFYNQHESSLNVKIKMLFQYVFPMKSNKWAYKVNAAGRFQYNVAPSNTFMLTQTGPGACIFCRKDTYLDSHFDEERWMDDFGYPLGEDQLFHYKMYLHGANEYIWYQSGAIHLDAGKANRKFNDQSIRKITAVLFLLWHRSIYHSKRKSVLRKLIALLSFSVSFILKFLYSFTYIIKGMWKAPIRVIQGLIDGIKYTNKPLYASLPYFDEM